ncbi:hypothetical protein UA08_06090 [Talaromyces atroroseus]|uniref:Uncharacterized protein n=1 Tax=Talaromyces atroroseus TaxID=1441469 RepID=A0A225AD97_TALAT|nr:hypothetical protein UA08_06090 [Talaromyces atroroseus]OKL58400.1 hypothetical protein UA08_06090 [Talaromyces atroroseus]
MPPKRNDQKNNTSDHNHSSVDASNATNKNSKHANPNENNNAEPSLWSKIQSSASTLIQDTVSRPSGAVLGADLAQILNESSHGKAGYSSLSSSSSSSSSFSGLSHAVNSSGAWSSTPSYSDKAGAGTESGNRFRSATTIPAQDLSFKDSFQYSHTDYEDYSQQKGKGKSKQYVAEAETQLYNMMNTHHFNDYEMAWINATRSDGILPTTSPSSSSTTTTTVTTANTPQDPFNQTQVNDSKEQDGAAVVSLLSDPSFQPGLVDNSHFNDAWDNDAADADGFPTTTITTRPQLMTTLSADEKRIIDSFRRQSELERSGSTGRITSRSLIPGIDTFLATSSYSYGMGEQEDDRNGNSALREAVLSYLPGAEDWVGVEERYHDEVWGYLRPVMEDAARELEERKDDGGGDSTRGRDGPAVQRLKMILRHMRGGVD